jgi:hypothetical protein
VRERFEREARALRTSYAAVLWAMERHMRQKNAEVAQRVHELREEIRRECGALAAAVGAALGPLLLWLTKREERKLEKGVAYEPQTFIERRNWAEA